MSALAVALAGFRERRRRPAYAVVLLAAVGLGYLAVPATDSHWTIVSLGGYRGVYNSAYTGTIAALAGALWLTVGGFFVVRTALAQDRATGVRELLAVTRLRTHSYLLGTFLGNLLVLGSMAAVLAVTALVLQLARGESLAIVPGDLLLPFVLFTLPVLAVTAALAVFWETVPLLRGGFGNVVWCAGSMVAIIAAQSPTAPLGGLGTPAVAASLRETMAAQGLRASDAAIGFMYLDDLPATFVWDGFPVTAGLVGERALLALLAVVVAVVPALWFGRSDPVRASGGPVRVLQVDETPRAAAAPVAYPRGAARARIVFPRLVVGELRVLTAGVSRWWWLVAALLVVAPLVAPERTAAALLLAAWGWPVLIWSRLGLAGREHGVDALLDACPAPVTRIAATWAAGVVFTAAVGAGPALRMALGGDAAGLAAWVAGAVFVPALASVLGLVSGAARLFQALYLGLWWCVVNGLAGLDYLGAAAGGPPPWVVASWTAVLLAVLVGAAGLRRVLR
ncbi:ABC transporter permease [Cryptosporangium aurantiacum]|uniref:ABC-2 family transporter protein n=1 Tax=Cryptosporangium aurantiacum TaxID=134849 RepID=A0A1M7RK87_9ACTN|nr:ABC transporter permease [Cryptosporangium aurantiacum]SHN46488.1 ABC-2 family transporter protein [Cryptosporangium aurantiacum]